MTIPDDDMPLTGDQQQPGQMNDEPASSQEDETTDAQALSNAAAQPLPPQEEAAPDFDFPRMEDDVAAFRRELDALQFTSGEHIPEEEPAPAINQTPPRRRRRSAHITERINASDLGERLESIVQRASPTVDFFVFSFFCGCILGVGYILDAPAILLIGILVAPLLGPWVGTALSTATGEIRLFRQTFGGMLTGMLMVFIVGLLAGLASRIFQPLTSSQAFYHARLWWPDLLMLVIGTVILVITFIQTDDKPTISSLMLAYEFYLPASAAGFGLGAGIQGLWPEAGLVFLIHTALSLIISLIIFFYMGFRPVDARGYALTASIIVIGLVIMAGFAGLGSLINIRGDQTYATAIVAAHTNTPARPTTVRPSPTLKPAAAASTVASATPSFTPSPEPSPTEPAITATIESTAVLETTPAPTLLPTPVYGRVESVSGGVMVRVKPGGASITTVQNGYLAEILGDTPVVLEGATWVHVIIRTPIRDIDGWVLLNLIVTATPSFSP
jgi:uncharacterized membrane protein